MTFRETSEYGGLARRLIRTTDRASLSTTLVRDVDGTQAWPFGSLVMLACDHDATPVLLMSDLSEHARNLARDPRASLLVDGTAGLEDALTGPRVTLLGRAIPDADPVLRRRYLCRHPGAALYAGFGDFRIYRFDLERGHLVAGFGKVRWLDRSDIAAAAPWREIEPALIERFGNRAEAIAARVGVADRNRESMPWRVTGIDPEGIDLRAGGDVARYGFVTPLAVPDEIEAVLAAADIA